VTLLYSYSHPAADRSAPAEAGPVESTSMPLSFSVVVHGKVTELPPLISSLLHNRKLPATPQMSRRMTQLLQSPGFSELQVLLHDAALPEKRLEEEDDSGYYPMNDSLWHSSRVRANSRNTITSTIDLTQRILTNDIGPCIIEQYQVRLLQRPCGHALQMPSQFTIGQYIHVSPREHMYRLRETSPTTTSLAL
jgi:hypothetical protein